MTRPDLDPRWEWMELHYLNGRVRYVKGPCNHLETVAVASGGTIVAHLCLTCDTQLPAEWRG